MLDSTARTDSGYGLKCIDNLRILMDFEWTMVISVWERFSSIYVPHRCLHAHSTLKKKFVLSGLFVPFNVLQIISGRGLLVVDGARDNHFRELSHWNITPRVQSCDIPSGHIILATGQSVFMLKYPLFFRAFDKVASTTHLKYLTWLDRIRDLPYTEQTLYHDAICAGFLLPVILL